MIKKIYSLMVLSLVATSSFLVAEIQYEIQDIGTLQTHSSEAIAINNQGQILGWYNIDGSPQGKHFFVRDRDGTFHELPNKESGTGVEINWRFLTDKGNAYGTFDGNANYAVLYFWGQKNTVVKVGNLPGKEISAVNNAGQVLIRSVVENENGKSIRRPVIWENGKVTSLKGLEGDIGIESEESYGFDMNNQGEVVGQSLTYLSYKNNIYKQVHAVKWVNGQAIDLHREIPKSSESSAIAINDCDEVLISNKENNYKYFIGKDGVLKVFNHIRNSINNSGYSYGPNFLYDNLDKVIFYACGLNNELKNDFDSIWMKISKIIKVNDNGEIIAHGETIYGEKHAVLLTPVSPN